MPHEVGRSLYLIFFPFYAVLPLLDLPRSLVVLRESEGSSKRRGPVRSISGMHLSYHCQARRSCEKRGM